MMLYITYGTVDYLEKLKVAHPDANLLLMQNDDTGILVHETNKKTIFNEPKSYEVLVSNGSLSSGSFSLLHHIPVSDEGRPLFEKQFQDEAKLLTHHQGISALRVLRPTKTDTYLILTLWEDEQYFKAWEQLQSSNKKYVSQQQYVPFPNPSYKKTYYVVEPTE